MKKHIYCKTMENLRNRVDVGLVSNKKDYLKVISKPSYMSQNIFYNDLAAIPKGKVTLQLNKSAYVGRCILDLSKNLIYDFHYDYIKSEYGNNSRLLIIDTDHLMCEIRTEVVYENFGKDKGMFDFSNYSVKGAL